MLADGRPWLSLVLFGPPQPWQRAGQTKKGAHYTQPESKRYKAALQARMRSAILDGGDPWTLRALFQLEVFVRFADERHRDLDNVLKAISDAGNKVVWDDDAHIDIKRIERVRHGLPRTEVSIFAIGEVPTKLRKRAVRRAS